MSRFIRGVSVTLGTRVASLLIGIASAVIVARALGPAGKGEYALIVLIPAFFQLAGGLGLDQAMVYLVARRRRESRAIAFTVLVTSVGLGILLLGAYAALTAFPPYISYLETVRVEAELIWLLILLLPLTLATQSLTAALLALEPIRVMLPAARSRRRGVFDRSRVTGSSFVRRFALSIDTLRSQDE